MYLELSKSSGSSGDGNEAAFAMLELSFTKHTKQFLGLPDVRYGIPRIVKGSHEIDGVKMLEQGSGMPSIRR